MLTSPSLAIEQELSSGEKLVWSGQPRSGIRLRGSDVFVIPFSIFWCGFAIFWEASAVAATARHGGPIASAFPLFGVPFVAIGLYFVFGRFIADARIRERTFYGITNERIIILTGLFRRRINSLNIRTLGDISLTERADGSGTITFGPSYAFGPWLSSGSWPGAGRYGPPCFDMIERARDVYVLIRNTQKAAT